VPFFVTPSKDAAGATLQVLWGKELLTHPAARGRALAKRIAVRMIADGLPAAGLIRYRALASSALSLAIARSLGLRGTAAS